MSIRGHLLWLVLAAVVPVLAFSASMMFRAVDQQRSAMRDEIKDTTERLTLDVDNELREAISALEVLAVSRAVTQDDLPDLYALGKRVLASRPAWANIILVGVGGEHLLNLRLPYGAPLPPLNRPDFFLEAARARHPVVSDLLAGVVAGRTLTVLAVPVFRDREIKYILACAIEAGNWEKYLRERLPPGMHAIVLDRQQRIVSRTLQGERYAGAKPVQTFLDALAVRPEGGLLQGPTLEGSEGYGAYRRSSFSGWTVAAFMAADDVEAPVRAYLVELAGGFLLLLGLSLVLAWVLGQRIARSIAQLTQSVRSVGKGGYPLPVDARIAEVREATRALDSAATLLAQRLAREQAARAELEAADEAKDNYLAMLGHELRNPLAPMSASLFVLESEAPASPAGRRALTVLGRQVRQMSRLLEDLLDVTRLASGKVQLHAEVVSLNGILRQAAEDHAEMARRAQVELTVEAPAQPVRVHGDPVRVAQVISNLLQNSLRFTPAGGRIELSLARAGASAEIRVRDTGAGIEPELLPRLFESFIRGAQDGARTRAGLGLGLAVVKGLAELHGGSVQAFSAGAGQGAEFVVRLPALDAPAREENERTRGHA